MMVKVNRLERGYMQPEAAQASCMLSVDKVKQGILALVAPDVSNVKLRVTVDSGKAMAYVHIRPKKSTKTSFRDFTRSVTLNDAQTAEGVTEKMLKRIKGAKMTAGDQIAEQVLSVINVDDQLTACLKAARVEDEKISTEFAKSAPVRTARTAQKKAEAIKFTAERLTRYSNQLVVDADNQAAREETLRTLNATVKVLMVDVEQLRRTLADFNE